MVVGSGKLTINGNGHIIDCSNNLSGIKIDNFGHDEKIIINNLTLVNINGHVIYSDSAEIILNNVVIVDCSNGSEIEGAYKYF